MDLTSGCLRFRKEAGQEIGGLEDWNVLMGPKLEKVGIAGNEAVRAACGGKSEKVVVVRILLDHGGRPDRPHNPRKLPERLIDLGELVVSHSMRATMARIAEYAAVFTQNRRRDNELEGVGFPQIDDAGDATVWGQVTADDDIGVKDDPHLYGWERMACLASSVRRTASSSLRLARSATSRI